MTNPTAPPANPFDPVAVTMSIVANLATDILKHYAPQLEGTLAGRALKRVGLIAPIFKDRLHESLKQALLRYFTRYPQYALWGVESFFVGRAIEAYRLEAREPTGVRLGGGGGAV